MIRSNRASLSVFSLTRTTEEIATRFGLESTPRRSSTPFDPHRHARWTIDVRDDGEGDDRATRVTLSAPGAAH